MDIKVDRKAITEASEKLKNWGRWGKDDQIGTQMLATGTDAIAGRQDWNKIRYADDTLMLCVQGATHWDALGHIFYEEKGYNGHDAKFVDSKWKTKASPTALLATAPCPFFAINRW